MEPGKIEETARTEPNAAVHAKTLNAVEPLVSEREEETAKNGDPRGATGMNPMGAAALLGPSAGTSSPNAVARVNASASAAAPTAVRPGASGAGADTDLGHLRILANPMANVEIDGKSRGAAPIADVALAPGTHFVRLDCAALGEAVAQNVPVAAGETVTISGDFTGAHGRILVRRTSASP
jgi:hypothetical protein